MNPLRGKLVPVKRRVGMVTRLSRDGKWARVQFVNDGQRPTVTWVPLKDVK